MKSIKVDMNYKFKDLEGKDIKEQVLDEDEKGNPRRDKEGFPLLKFGSPLTLRKICIEVLINPPVDIDPQTRRPKEIDSDEKLKMWNLAQEIHASNGLVDLESDEIKMLKKLINKRYTSPLTVSQAFATLDPTAEAKGKADKK